MSDTYTEFGALKYDPAQIARQGYGTAAAGATDDKLIVGFYRKSILNVAKSQQEGKRICEDRDFVKIQHPGESLNIVDRPVQDSDKHRWPRQWSMFEQGKKQVPDGIPVTLLYPDKPSITDMLIGYNIHTVEQLAGLSAHGIGTVGMGCQEWVNKAQKYLEQANKGVDFHRFEKAMAEKDHTISLLQKQVESLSASVNGLLHAKKEPQNFDVQTSQINHTMAARNMDDTAVNFAPTIISPDLSGETRPRKQRSDKGQPRGPRKEH